MSEAIKKLKTATMELNAQVSHEVCDQMLLLVKVVCDEAEKNQCYIDCLHSGGVDNWEWYGESLEEYWEKYD